jgi:nitrogen fixation/metabolism regulation signal transduction histidine kinase
MKLYTKIVILSTALLIVSGGVSYIVTIAKVKDVLIANDISATYLGEIQTRTMLVSAFVLVIAIILALVLSKQIIAPFTKLAEAAQEFSKGNFKVDINTEGKDEVSMLGRELKKSSLSLF